MESKRRNTENGMKSKRRNTVERRKRRTNHPHNCLLSIKLFFHRFSEIKTIKITVGLLFDCSGPKWNRMEWNGKENKRRNTVERRKREGPITPTTVYSALSCSFTGFQKLKQ
jgi:hypothetical protein